MGPRGRSFRALFSRVDSRGRIIEAFPEAVMVRPEIAAFVAEHRLTPELADALTRLVDSLASSPASDAATVIRRFWFRSVVTADGEI